jgi:hypothetical protein
VTLSEPFLLALAQTAGATPDTIVTVGSGVGLAHWANVLSDIATIVIAFVLIAVALAVIPAMWYTRRIYGMLDGALRRVRENASPIVRQAEGAMDNVHYVTTAVRGDVERVQRMIDEAQRRLESSTALADQRIREFNALLKVMQEEAENLFVGTASTVRGVQAGTARLSRSAGDVAGAAAPATPQSGPPPA